MFYPLDPAIPEAFLDFPITWTSKSPFCLREFVLDFGVSGNPKNLKLMTCHPSRGTFWTWEFADLRWDMEQEAK